MRAGERNIELMNRGPGCKQVRMAWFSLYVVDCIQASLTCPAPALARNQASDKACIEPSVGRPDQLTKDNN